MRWVQAFVDAWHDRRLESSVEAGPQTCAACGASERAEIGVDAYRCVSCGYEGGPGLAAMLEARRRELFALMPVDERRRSALVDLKEAKALTVSAIGALRRSFANPGGGPLAHGMSTQYVDAMQLLAEAQQRIADAELKLGVALDTLLSASDEPMARGFGTARRVLDGAERPQDALAAAERALPRLARCARQVRMLMAN